MLDLVHHIRESHLTLNGTLSFLNQWEYFSNGACILGIGRPTALIQTSDPLTQHGQLTKTGPYAGSLTAFRTGMFISESFSPSVRSSDLDHIPRANRGPEAPEAHRSSVDNALIG